MRDYFITAPAYTHTSAGIKCLYILAENLKAKGFVVKISNGFTVDTCGDVTDNTVVVYPDIIDQNYLKAKHVVSWHLNRPEFWGYKRMDVPTFAYSRGFSEPDEKILFVNHIEKKLFNEVGAPERTLQCFFTGIKPASFQPNFANIFSQTMHLTKNCCEISFKFPFTRPELADLFRRSKVFYSWDNMTSLTIEATLCGCPAVIIPDGCGDRTTKSEWFNSGTYYYGQNWREGEPLEIPIKSAVRYATVEKLEQEDLRNFIEFTQNM